MGDPESAMEPVYDDDFTLTLARHRAGEPGAHNRLIEMIYADLRRLARRHLIGNRWFGTMNTTALINESYLRLVTPAAQHVQTRAHFLNLASQAMRQIVSNYARARLRERRRIERPGEISEEMEAEASEMREADQCVKTDDALKDLAKVNERQARVVECRFFGGLSEEETAAALDTSVRTVQREWAEAKAWLGEHMRADD